MSKILFEKNKANLAQGRIDVKCLLKGVYGNMLPREVRKNKPNSEPNNAIITTPKGVEADGERTSYFEVQNNQNYGTDFLKGKRKAKKC